MLLRNDVLRTHIVWREEMAGIEQQAGLHLNWTHRQKLNWQVGFSFWNENKAGAARGQSR
jgi:hypothetical protein